MSTHYDYIVVGGGTAGLILSRVLSARYSVLVLEAGPDLVDDPNIRDSTKALTLASTHYPYYWWQGDGIRQEGADDRYFNWKGGRLLGGSSSVNGEQLILGTRATFEDWERIGGPLWSPKNVYERYRKIFDYLPTRSAPKEPTRMNRKLTQAMSYVPVGPTRTVGTIKYYNDPDTPMGAFYRWDLTQLSDGTRVSSTRFLENIVSDRLTVVTQTTVTRVLFDNMQAVGVDAVANGVGTQLFASKGVIMCAGIKSPKLLMLSGIGPREHLEEKGIPCLVDLPVGENLLNHTMVSAEFATGPDDLGTPPDDPESIFTGGAFVPDLTDEPTRRGFEIINFSSGPGSASVLGLHLRPKSHGRIRLHSDDPLQMELVDFGYLTDRRDMVSLKGFYRDYVLPLSDILGRMDTGYTLSSPSVETIMDDGRLEEHIRGSLSQAEHYLGTCAMGSVVDSVGKVFGTTGLYVADDSIMPINHDGNTQAPAYLIGWTIANSLLQRRA